MDVQPRSERDLLGHAKLVTDLRGIVSRVATTAAGVASASQQMASTSEETGRAVEEIASAVGDVASARGRRVARGGADPHLRRARGHGSTQNSAATAQERPARRRGALGARRR